MYITESKKVFTYAKQLGSRQLTPKTVNKTLNTHVLMIYLVIGKMPICVIL